MKKTFENKTNRCRTNEPTEVQGNVSGGQDFSPTEELTRRDTFIRQD